MFYLVPGNFNLEGINVGVFIGSWDNTYGQGKISAVTLPTAEPFTEQMGASPIELGTWYDMGDGTSRILYTGNSGHPTALLLKEPILDMVDFFEQALAPAPIPAEGISYAAKEIGTAHWHHRCSDHDVPRPLSFAGYQLFLQHHPSHARPGLGSQRSLPVLSDYARHYQHFDLPVGHL